MTKVKRSFGWTLLEMLIVLVIIGVSVGAVAWRMHAWELSSERIRLNTLSKTWEHMRSLAAERSMRVSCDVSAQGWQCQQWTASLSGQLQWMPLKGFPWQSKRLWPKRWFFLKKEMATQTVLIYPDGQVSPMSLSVCDVRGDRCWLLWKGIMVES